MPKKTNHINISQFVLDILNLLYILTLGKIYNYYYPDSQSEKLTNAKIDQLVLEFNGKEQSTDSAVMLVGEKTKVIASKKKELVLKNNDKASFNKPKQANTQKTPILNNHSQNGYTVMDFIENRDKSVTKKTKGKISGAKGFRIDYSRVGVPKSQNKIQKKNASNTYRLPNTTKIVSFLDLLQHLSNSIELARLVLDHLSLSNIKILRISSKATLEFADKIFINENSKFIINIPHDKVIKPLLRYYKNQNYWLSLLAWIKKDNQATCFFL